MITLDELRATLANCCCISERKITTNIRLVEDLGIDGDDASELMQLLKEKYRLSADFINYDQYFGAEPGTTACIVLILVTFIRLLGIKAVRNNDSSLTVGQLLEFINHDIKNSSANARDDLTTMQKKEPEESTTPNARAL